MNSSLKKSLKQRKNIFIVLLIFCLNFFSFSNIRGEQDLILPNHWIYDALLSIEVESGIVTFSDQSPISIAELKSYLKKIDFEKLSDVGKIQYQKIVDYINEDFFSVTAGSLCLSSEPSFNPEFYYKSEEVTPWIFDYTKRNALVDIPFKLHLLDYVTLYMGFQGTQNYTKRFQSDNYFNQCFTLDSFDPALVHQTYLSTGYTWNENTGINFKLGVGSQSIGNTLMPSIILSEYLTDTPYVNLRIFSPYINYNCNVTQLTRMTYLYTHRLEAILFDKLQLSFIEGVLPYNQFDLRMLSPFAIYHGYGLFNEFSGECSSYFGIKASLTLSKYLRLYALYSQNEHTMSSEKSHGESSPEGNGFQIGLESYIPLKKGYLHFGGEFYYATPYMFIKESPNVSFARVFSEMVYDSPNYYQWMSNPYGPDSLAFKIIVGYENPSKWSLDCVYNFAALGEFSLTKVFQNANWNKQDLTYSDWVYDMSNASLLKTPHGTVMYYNNIYLTATWSPQKYITFTVQPGYKFIYNYDNKKGNFKQGFEFVLGTKIALSKIGNYKKSFEF